MAISSYISVPEILSPNGGETIDTNYSISWNEPLIYTVYDDFNLLNSNVHTSQAVLNPSGASGSTFEVVREGLQSLKILVVTSNTGEAQVTVDIFNTNVSGEPTGSVVYTSSPVTIEFDGTDKVLTIPLDGFSHTVGNKYLFVLKTNNSFTYYLQNGTNYPNLSYYYNTSYNGSSIFAKESNYDVAFRVDYEGDKSKLVYDVDLLIDTSPNNLFISNPGETTMDYNFLDEPQTSLARLWIQAYDDYTLSDADISDGVFTIRHNLPPSPPTNLNPSGEAVDRSIVQRLSWTYNDPDQNDLQSKAVLEWRKQGISTWNVVNVNSNRQYFDISSNVFPTGQIEWRVKTYDQSGAVSPYSSISVFTSADPTDAPMILNPSSSVSVASPTIQWTVPEQTAYQILVDDSLGTNVWDSGEVASTNKARTIGTSLLNGGQYIVKVRVKNEAGLWTEYASLNITVSYTPPAKPIITVSGATGHIVIEIDNPNPTGTQPIVSRNEVYKRIDGNWAKIATDILFVPYRDYAVASGEEYDYKVRAIGENNTFSESGVSFASTTLRGVWLHTINNAEVTAYNFKYDGGGRESSWEIQSSMMEFKGRKRPMIETGEMTYDRIDFNLTLKDSTDKEALERIIKSREIVCYRDGRGRLRFGVFTQMPLSDENWGGYTTSLQLLYIDYKEDV